MLHDLSPDQIRLLFYVGTTAGAITIVAIFLALLVRYTVFFAVLGAAALIAAFVWLPHDLAAKYAPFLLGAGIVLFVLLTLIYEWVQWRRHQTMLSVRSRVWAQGWRMRGGGRGAPVARARRRS